MRNEVNDNTIGPNIWDLLIDSGDLYAGSMHSLKYNTVLRFLVMCAKFNEKQAKFSLMSSSSSSELGKASTADAKCEAPSLVLMWGGAQVSLFLLDGNTLRRNHRQSSNTSWCHTWHPYLISDITTGPHRCMKSCLIPVDLSWSGNGGTVNKKIMETESLFPSRFWCAFTWPLFFTLWADDCHKTQVKSRLWHWSKTE